MERICENCGGIFEGDIQARFDSDACRKAFGRAQAKKQAELEQARQAYIEDAVRLARRDAEERAGARREQMTHTKDLEPIDVEARVERARAYAGWRWGAAQSGEVGSL